ncbi:MAG: CcoQ/FixQ family Cbb3-type cytochrome c oxidase assembly chaperone [Ignavibacteria bacterium]|nr:CcoQ/FixQ family Cbb3-type cytochrome c oxidase assembly chaperone [Ignavibacteria bacterium]
MFKHYFELIEGIEIYPIFSLMVFIIFFTLIFGFILKTDKKYIKEMSNLPLEGDDENEK